MKTGATIPNGSADAFALRAATAHQRMKKERHEAIYLVSAEVVFILLPFILTGIVLVNRGKFREFFSQPEWALAASVIMGQALVKVISGFLSIPTKGLAWQKVSFGVAVVIGVFLAPALIIVSLVLNGGSASRALVGLQIALFLMGLLLFFFGGWGSECLRAWAKYKQDTASPRREDLRESGNPNMIGKSGTHFVRTNGDGFTLSDWKAWLETQVMEEKLKNEKGNYTPNPGSAERAVFPATFR